MDEWDKANTEAQIFTVKVASASWFGWKTASNSTAPLSLSPGVRAQSIAARTISPRLAWRPSFQRRWAR
jgi:hypothetical protein